MTAKECFRRIRPPAPILDRAREAALTDRQREILDNLLDVFAGGFADLTMVTLASRLKCSLRTLYAVAPTRDELMLIGVERYLWHVGRAARDAMTDDMSALDALEAYLHASTVALSSASKAFARDLVLVPAVNDLITVHNDYVFEVTRALLDMAVDEGEMPPIDTAALARVLAGLGWAFTRPEIEPMLTTTPKAAADAVVDVIMRGLRSDDAVAAAAGSATKKGATRKRPSR
jgi:AcrR family transcriptional regulator